MSSSLPTDRPVSHTARWRGPAGWSLRTRLVATMIALLTVLGLAVGGTTELALRNTLYDQHDEKVKGSLDRTAAMSHYKADGTRRPDGPPGGGRHGGGPPDSDPAGAKDRAGGGPGSSPDPSEDAVPISPAANPASDKPAEYPAVADGALTLFLNRDGTVGTVGHPWSKMPSGVLRHADYQESDSAVTDPIEALSPGVVQTLKQLPRTRELFTVKLDGLGDYRLTAQGNTDGTTFVVGLPLEEPRNILLRVAVTAAGSTVLAVLVAGFAGALIVRRTLRPLSRVAATATRVSEMRLDRGEVDLVQRVPAADTDPRTEVGQVGAALNRMLDHVGTALERRHASEMQVRQFVADASHELRTPLAAIRGYAELSRRSRGWVPDDVAHVLRRVESEATRMTTLVEDLLLLARLDAGRPLAHDPVDLTMLVVDAVSDAHAAGPQHYWQLDVPEEPVVITGDGSRLHQVLANLLANARTHTPEGTTVMVQVYADRTDALLRVVDGGPGIAPDLLPHIFERFARGDSSRSRAAGSTGLGLSIVHAVVTAHRGTVSVHSMPGRTEFTVRLPLAAPERSPRPHGVQQHLTQVFQ